MNILWTIWFFILALAVLVVVHELGHFLVARACGVRVMRFSVAQLICGVRLIST